MWRRRLVLLPRLGAGLLAMCSANALLVVGGAWFVGSVGPTLSLLVLAVVAVLGGDWTRASEFVAAIGSEVHPTAIWLSPSQILAAAIVLLLVQTLAGYRLSLRDADVRTLSPVEAPQLHSSVTRLAATADVPAPDLATVESERPNCFTVGRPGAATIVLTSGLRERLDARELRAVLAHEIAHLVHRDVTVATVATALVPLTDAVVRGVPQLIEASLDRLDGAVARVDDRLPRDRIRRCDEDAAESTEAQASLPVGSLAAFFGFATVLLLVLTRAPAHYLAYAATVLVFFRPVALVPQLLYEAAAAIAVGFFSRTRELAADRTAAQLTGDPAALASALQTVHGGNARADPRLRSAMQALCIAPTQFGDGVPSAGTAVGALHGRPDRPPVLLVSTHPPVEERVERLAALAGDGAA